MDITTERPSPDVAVIALDGELDGSNFEQVIEAGRIAIAAGASRGRHRPGRADLHGQLRARRDPLDRAADPGP